MTISPEEAIERQLNACTETGGYLPGRDLMMDTYMEQIVAGTAARAQETFYAICQLARDRQTVQAAMLCRSLFEDMIVAHWLVLHEDDPEFLVERYLGHLDAMRWNEAVTAGRHGVEPPDVSELAGREDELRREFGDYAQRDWWGVRRNGSRITMPEVVTVLEEAERFHPRMRGEKPILREMYEKAQKWNTQLLHHTASGMPLALNRDDQLKPRTIQRPSRLRCWRRPTGSTRSSSCSFWTSRPTKTGGSSRRSSCEACSMGSASPCPLRSSRSSRIDSTVEGDLLGQPPRGRSSFCGCCPEAPGIVLVSVCGRRSR